MRIVLFVRSLDVGGTQRQVALLAKALAAKGEKVAVVAMYDGGCFFQELKSAGVEVFSAGKRGRWDVAGFWHRLVRLLAQIRPDAVYSFLGMPNVIAALAVRRLRHRPVLLFGVRASAAEMHRYDWLLRASMWMEVCLSAAATLVVCNSKAGMSHAARVGFPLRKLRYVPNGVDINAFRPDPSARARVRSGWGVAVSAPLVGMVARLDPMKGYATFLEAAALVRRANPEARFVCVGSGPSALVREYRHKAALLSLDEVMVWAGERNDIPDVLCALDVCVSASAFGEGASNSVLEAMACGATCVVTDVGDSAELVGDMGLVVPPRDPVAMAGAISAALSTRIDAGLLHASVRTRFAPEVLADRTIAVLQEAVDALG